MVSSPAPLADLKELAQGGSGCLGAAEPGTQRQRPSARGSPPPPRRAVRGTRIFTRRPYRAGSVRTLSQAATPDGGRGIFFWTHPLSAVGTLTLSRGIGGGGGGRSSPPRELTSPSGAAPPPPPKAPLSEHPHSAQFGASCVGSSFVRFPWNAPKLGSD